MEWADRLSDLFSNKVSNGCGSQVGYQWTQKLLVILSREPSIFGVDPYPSHEPIASRSIHHCASRNPSSGYVQICSSIPFGWWIVLWCFEYYPFLRAISKSCLRSSSVDEKDSRSYSSNCQTTSCRSQFFEGSTTSDTSSRRAFFVQLNRFTAHQLASCWRQTAYPFPSTQPLDPQTASSMRERSRITTSSSAFWSMRNFKSLSDRLTDHISREGGLSTTKPKTDGLLVHPKGTAHSMPEKKISKKQHGKLWHAQALVLRHPGGWLALKPRDIRWYLNLMGAANLRLQLVSMPDDRQAGISSKCARQNQCLVYIWER